MNFETKYLIRWGIPGWIMMMILLPFFITIHFETLANHVTTSSNLLALGAALTLLGVPLGYLLNQIHHSLFWVIPKRKGEQWKEYFDSEILLDEKIKDKPEDKERYRYLLSRKHELGGITVSLAISAFVILIANFWGGYHDIWSWLYFVVVATILVIIFFSRKYSSANIDHYYKHYLNRE